MDTGPKHFRVIGQSPDGTWQVRNEHTGGIHHMKALALPVKDAAAALSITPRALTALITAGDIAAFRVGRSWRVSIDAIFAYIAAAEVKRDRQAHVKAVEALGQMARGRKQLRMVGTGPN